MSDLFQAAFPISQAEEIIHVRNWYKCRKKCRQERFLYGGDYIADQDGIDVPVGALKIVYCGPLPWVFEFHLSIRSFEIGGEGDEPGSIRNDSVQIGWCKAAMLPEMKYRTAFVLNAEILVGVHDLWEGVDALKSLFLDHPCQEMALTEFSLVGTHIVQL